MVILILALFWVTSNLSCVNNQFMKYDSKIVGRMEDYPHDHCKLFLLRTCCGSSNIDNLRQKIEKMTHPKQQLSNQCRQRLGQLLCYPCDGDIGSGEKQGVCPEFSQLLYEACSDDYFLFQITNVLKPCDDDSIACSKLSTIVHSSNLKIAQLFGFKNRVNSPFDKVQCFDGVSSSVKKGLPKFKINYVAKVTPKKKKVEENESHPFADITKNLFISVGILMGATIVIMKCLKRNEKDDQDDE